MTVVLVLLASYLLGSIPFSYLVARLRGVDVRTVGSGNVGATNVMRSAGKAAGIAAFLLDAAKGAVAALLARKFAPGLAAPPLAAVSAIVGHMYPVWLGFRGGKGVATGAGAFLPLAPLATAAGLAAFALAAALSRHVSVGSMTGAIVLAASAAALGAPWPVWLAAAAMAALIVWKHRENIRRLADGTESRIGARRPETPEDP
ncbi:MAG: glycerol-3-phosphate 1-O-acyltransferase PlsY [Vicinamibacteria bacterium]